MSQEKVEIVRRLVDAWNAGMADEAFSVYWHPQAVLYFPDGFPEPGPWVGRSAIIGQFRRLREDFGEQHVTASGFVSHGDWVVVRNVWAVRGDRSGIEGEFEVTSAFRLADGQVAEARYYWSYSEALKAVGLEE